MIPLPNFTKSFEYENNFYLSCGIDRFSKVLAHYELFKKSSSLPGSIVECGIFKGISLIRFAIFRELFENSYSKKIIAFDIFGKFPKTKFYHDKKIRNKFIREAGEESISTKQLRKVLTKKKINKNIELVKGDITKTVPSYLKKHPELRISFLNLDTDVYEPAVTILENFYPRMVKGGILMLDDYNVFPGETQAVEEFFQKKKIAIKKLSFSSTPAYVIK